MKKMKIRNATLLCVVVCATSFVAGCRSLQFGHSDSSEGHVSLEGWGDKRDRIAVAKRLRASVDLIGWRKAALLELLGKPMSAETVEGLACFGDAQVVYYLGENETSFLSWLGGTYWAFTLVGDVVDKEEIVYSSW